MFNAKESFMKEVNKIKNDRLRTVAETLVEDAPEYFWHNAASSSGKHHPQCDLGEGGLVRHSIMTAIAANDLVISEIFVEDTQYNRDLAIFTGLFHDVIKYGDNKIHTEFAHPILSGVFVKERLEKAEVDEDTTNIICRAIFSHMGKWTTSTYSPGVTLDIPSTSFQKLIHTADYVVSRKYIGGLDEWGYIFTNEKSNLSEEDKNIIKQAIDKNNINESEKESLGIIRKNEEILSIWNSLLKGDQISERQHKYLELAKKSM
ncbi:MAG: HD domain-containing protein [Bacilli bacterium]|nr:HD domain-containing protein [Bacilli bacterium]